MSEPAAALGRAALLLASAALIAKLFVAGEMAKYITPALDPLTALTGVVLAAMGVMEGWRALRTRADRDAAATHDFQDADNSHDGLEPTVERGLTYAVVLLPIVLGLALTPRAMGTSALAGERVTRLLLTFAPGSSGVPRAPKPDEALDDTGPVLAYLRRVGDGSMGQSVRVTGMAMRSDALEAGEFAVLRYAIVHCVADARPVALLVVAPASVNIQSDQWVQIDGELSSRAREGAQLVTIVARRITPVPEPNNPYLFSAY
jgi:putative membrane protein